MSDPAQPTRDEIERLRRTVEAMQRRLEDVEAVLAALAPPPSPQVKPRDEPPHVLPRAARADDAAPWQRRAESSAPHAHVGSEAPTRIAGPVPPPIPPFIPRAGPTCPAAMPPLPVAAPRPTPARAGPSRSIENVIGQNWASWVGAIVLFLGIVFFLKYAWDQGWIRPSPAMRVAAAVASGAALAAAGEWLYWRRVRGLAG